MEKSDISSLIKNGEVGEFFKNSHIFITGATGFVGKVLVEKLLRSCDGIEKIYILIREKYGNPSEVRFKNFMKDQIFDRIRTECPETLEKLEYVTGDITMDCLGLTDFDRQKLIDSVNVVFNSAATVRLNDPIYDAANMNTFGTQRVMELCTKILNLKSVVHVSTGYCNSKVDTFEESVCKEHHIDKNTFLKLINELPRNFIDSISDKLLGNFENSYLLSKAMAEQIVLEYSNKIPVSIIRPTIVTAAKQEPYPGFVDNYQAINSMILCIGQGYQKAIVADSSAVIDMIPVDTVVNTMIGIAWMTGIQINRNLEVYNCSTGSINPITVGKLSENIKRWSKLYPSEKTIMYPFLFIIKSSLIYKIISFLLEYLPAYALDTIVKILGLNQKYSFLRICSKVRLFAESIQFVVLRSWQIRVCNMGRLSIQMSKMQDCEKFPIDLRSLQWDVYMENYIRGFRKFVLKENDETIPKSKTRLSIILCLQIFFICLGFIPLIMFKLYS